MPHWIEQVLDQDSSETGQVALGSLEGLDAGVESGELLLDHFDDPPLNPRIGTCLLLKTQRSKEVAIAMYKLEETHH